MKNKKLLITILMFSILLTFLIPVVSSAEEETEYNPYDHVRWTLNSSWEIPYSTLTPFNVLGYAYIDGSTFKFDYIGFDYSSQSLIFSRDDVEVSANSSQTVDIDFISFQGWENTDLNEWFNSNGQLLGSYGLFDVSLKYCTYTLDSGFVVPNSSWYQVSGSVRVHNGNDFTEPYYFDSFYTDMTYIAGSWEWSTGCITFALADGSYYVIDPSVLDFYYELEFTGGADTVYFDSPLYDFFNEYGSIVSFDYPKNPNDSSSNETENTPSTSPTITYKEYDEYTLPTVDRYLNDTYKVAIIFCPDRYVSEGVENIPDTFYLVVGQSFDKDYIHIAYSASGSPESYCSIYNWQWYYYNYMTDDDWVLDTGDSTNSVICRTADYDLLWSSGPIYTDSTRQEYFFQPTPPMEVTTTIAGIITAPMLAVVMTEVVEMLPMILLFLVGYLTLRKALAILVLLLEKA